jgi:type IV secretory pathway VirB4 component
MIEGLIGVAAMGAAALLPVVLAKGDPRPARSPAGKELSFYLPQRRLVRPGVVRNATSYTAVCRISAEDPALKDKEAIKNVTYGLASTLGLLQQWPGAFAQFYVDRYHTHEYDRGLNLGENPVHELLDDLREDEFLRRRELFGTDCFCAFTWPMPKKTQERFRSLLSEGVESAMRGESEILEEFESVYRQFDAGLRVSVETQRLEKADEFSDLLRFFNRFGAAGEDHPFRIPSAYIPLHEMMGKEYAGGVEVRMGRHEIGCIDIVTPPATIEPLCLQPLAQLAVPHTLVVRVMGMSLGEAQSHLDDAIIDHQGALGFNRAKIQSPEHARAIKQLTDARGNVGDESRRLGKTTTSIVIRAKTRAQVSDRQEAIIGALSARGYVAEIPRDEAFDTFIATFPGQGKHGMRTFPIDALETATSLPIFGNARGERYSSSDSFPKAIHIPPVMYSVNPAGELYRLHMNAADSDLMHGLICAPTKTGKSVLVGSIAAGIRARLPQSVVTIIERGRSARPLCKMSDGSYHDILGEEDTPEFALFVDAHEPFVQAELTAIFEEWANVQGLGATPDQRKVGEVTPEQRKSILAAVRVIGSIVDPSKRTYTAFLSAIRSRDDGHLIEPALEAYGPGGVLGSLFNHTADSFSLKRFNVIDTTNLRARGEKFVYPVLRLIFYKIDTAERKMKRAFPDLTSHIFVDEQQELTCHKFGAEWAARQMKEGRKHDRGLWLIGPTVSGFSSMIERDAVVNAAQTRLYGQDTAALSGDTPDDYKAMGLPESGIARLPVLRKRNFLLHRPEEGTLTELDFGLSEDFRAVIGDSRKNAVVDRFMALYPPEQYGQRWKVEMLIAHPSVEVQTAGHRLRDLVERRAYAAEGDE